MPAAINALTFGPSIRSHGLFPYPPPLVDMKAWPKGPWLNEPCAGSWIDDRSKLPCAMIRNPFMGTWCGYVAVDPLHPFHGKSYSDRVPMPDFFRERQIQMGRDVGPIDLLLNAFDEDPNTISVSILLPAHGSLSYSREDDQGLWWFGFDCNHYLDLAPTYLMMGFPTQIMRNATYRDHDYVYGIITRLASALIEVRELATSKN